MNKNQWHASNLSDLLTTRKLKRFWFWSSIKSLKPCGSFEFFSGSDLPLQAKSSHYRGTHTAAKQVTQILSIYFPFSGICSISINLSHQRWDQDGTWRKWNYEESITFPNGIARWPTHYSSIFTEDFWPEDHLTFISH
jgi:hypothetical protein